MRKGTCKIYPIQIVIASGEEGKVMGLVTDTHWTLYL